jgi:uncharacterized phiE125 gp8 family phage protein
MMAGGVTSIESGPMAVSIAECKAYLRLERDDEDAAIAGFVRTAMGLCEAFTGQWLIIREGEQQLARTAEWQRLSVVPVVAIIAVVGSSGVVAGSSYETDIDSDGTGWIRLLDPTAVTAPVVRFRAGLGADWNGVPEALRQGLIRLVVHLFTHRDAPDAGAPPAAVAAMWRPFRRLRLG